MKRIILTLIAFQLLTASYAQKKNEVAIDAWFQEYTREPFQQGRDGTILLEIKNTGEDVNDCIAKAKQQAIFAVIFTGYTEANNIPASPALSPTDVALYHEKIDFFKEFFGNTSQFGTYVPKAQLNPKRPVSKIDKKTVEAYVIVTVEVDRLRKQLEAQNIFPAVTDFGFKPSVIIIPSDAWMEKNGFFRTVNNQGVTEKIYDYANAINNDRINQALNVVKDKFGGPNGSFQVQDIARRLGDIKLEEAKNNARSLEKQESWRDIFARVLAADLWVKVNLVSTPIDKGLKTQFQITMSATDPYTGNEAIPGKTIDKTTVGDDYFNLMKNAMNGAAADFQPKLFAHFKRVLDEGLQGTISISFLDEVDANFNTKFSYKSKEYELSRIVDVFLKHHSLTRETQGSVTGSTRTYSVHIPLEYMDDLTEEKERNTFENFSRQIRDELTELGLQSESEVQGLGKVNILITGLN